MQAKNFVPSPQQQSFFDWVRKGRGNAILEAVAGAGKTTTIVKATELMTGSIFLGAYNSKMAKELESRITGRPQVQGTRVVAKTFHGTGYGALKYNFKTEKLDVDDKKVVKILDKYITDQKRDDLVELTAITAATISMAKQRGIGAMLKIDDTKAWEEMIEHFGIDEDLPEDPMFTEAEMIEKLISFAQFGLKESNKSLATVDFDDMVYLPLQKNIRMFQNDWVLIDEAQDTNPTRREMAKRMLKPGGRLVAVGDPRQAIFGFTGADNDSLEQLQQTFNCQKMPLTVTYRCPKAVVKHARAWVEHIEAHESAPQGEVNLLPYKELMSKVQPGDAILCRYNKYLVNLCFKLIREGHPAKIEGRAIGDGLIMMTKKWKVKSLDALKNRVVEFKNREIEKAKKKDNLQAADNIEDKCETMLVLIDRAIEQKMETVLQLKTMIEGMFKDDVGNDKKVITLCSVHRSKGMEWKRVFLLGRAEFMPSKFAKLDWQIKQENNLIYVGVTRAMEVLTEVHGVKEEDKRKEA